MAIALWGQMTRRFVKSFNLLLQGASELFPAHLTIIVNLSLLSDAFIYIISDSRAWSCKGYQNFPLVSSKPKQMPVLWPSNSTLPGIYPREVSACAYQKIMVEEVHSSFIHNSTNLETTQMSTKSKMENKLWCIYTTEYSTAMKKKELLIYTAMWRALPHKTVNERSQARGCMLYVILKKRSREEWRWKSE